MRIDEALDGYAVVINASSFYIREISVENKDKNEIKYAVIYSMIMDLYEQGSIDKATAEKINSKCAEQLECRKMAVR